VKARPNTVVMVGPSMSGRGGVAAVCRTLLRSNLAEEFRIRYVATVGDGGLPSRLWRSVVGVGGAVVAVASFDVALVHLHVASRGSFWRKALIAHVARMLGKRVVVHLHGALFHEFAGSGTAIRRHAIRRLFDRADAIVVLSEEWERRVRAFARPRKIRVVPNPVDLPARISDKDARAVLFAGRLGRRKGIFDLVDGFAAVVGRFPGWRLLIAGDGDATPVSDAALRAGVGEQVDVLGWQNNEDMAQLRWRGSVFCLPSYDEGLPVALLEAMAAGMCCIVSPVGGIPEHIVDAVNGRIVTAGDVDGLANTLAEVLADAEMRSALGQAARKHVSEVCSTDVVAEEIGALYRTLGLEPGSGGPR
jgi:glycosyltransferase involved in cell wall biosynthesis